MKQDNSLTWMTSENNGGYNDKYQTNASGKTAKENYGSGPRVGNNDGKIAGPARATAKAQYRGVGGTTVKCPGESINFGRGPTKGNA